MTTAAKTTESTKSEITDAPVEKTPGWTSRQLSSASDWLDSVTYNHKIAATIGAVVVGDALYEGAPIAYRAAKDGLSKLMASGAQSKVEEAGGDTARAALGLAVTSIWPF